MDGARVARALNRRVGPALERILGRRVARELRELVRGQHVAGGLEDARLVERVVAFDDRPAQLALEARDRLGDAGHARRDRPGRCA